MSERSENLREPSERQIVTALIREWAEREPRISTKDVTGPDFYAVWADIARNLLASDWLASQRRGEPTSAP